MEPRDEVSGGHRISKYRKDELLSKICGYSIAFEFNYTRGLQKNVWVFGRTKIKLAGGSKISGGRTVATILRALRISF